MATTRALALRETKGGARLAAGSYRAADTTRSRAYNGGALGGTGDRHADDRTRYLVRELSRSLRRDGHQYDVFIGRWLDDLGVPMPRALSSDPAWNARAGEMFKATASRKDGFDARRMATWGELFRLWASGVATDGDIGLIRTSEGRVATVEAEQIAAPASGNQYARTIGGVRVDRYGAPQGFYVAPISAGGFPDVNRAEFYPSDQVELLAHRTRHSQTRGMPPLVSALDDVERIDSVLESTVISAEQLSSIYGVISQLTPEQGRSLPPVSPLTSAGRAAPISSGHNGTDNVPEFVDVGRGQMLMLYGNQKFESVQQTQPNMNVPPFLTAMLRLIGMGMSYPYEIAFMDLGTLNWSASKTLITLARDGMERWRTQVFEPALTAIYRWWLARQIRAGLIDAIDGWDAVAWDWPQLPWPDPLKEEARNQLAFANKTDSPQRVIGHTWRDIYLENAEAERLRDQLAIERIVEAQRLCTKANEKDPALCLHWSHVVTLAGATSAPGAYLQGASNAGQSGSGTAPDKTKPDDSETESAALAAPSSSV